MNNTKEFVRQRISIFAGMELDPNVDNQVVEILKRKFNIFLPQRPTLEESLESAITDHEIVSLIIKYRGM